MNIIELLFLLWLLKRLYYIKKLGIKGTREVIRRMFMTSPRIHLFFGKTGDGKSTTATAMMYKIYLKNCKNEKWNVRQEKKYQKKLMSVKLRQPPKPPKYKKIENIYTNIKTSFPTIQITKDDFIDGHLIAGYVFIDEGSLMFNNRNFKTFTMQQQAFFRYHRKNGLSIFVFSQSNDDTDKVIRGLTHKEYIVKKFMYWIIVRDVKLFVGVDELTKDITTQRKIGSLLFSRRYFWAYWSLLFDTKQKME